MVRHAESIFVPGVERTRGLSDKGELDAIRVADLLQNEIDVVVSSPYRRAIQTVEELARRLNIEIELYEDFRERQVAADGYLNREGKDLYKTLEELFEYPELAMQGGESNRAVQERGINTLNEVINKYEGKRIAVGTHGNIMTIILNHFDPKFDYSFWKKTTIPDIYRMDFKGTSLLNFERLWS
jgi:2,3-bisphosphoglycerate-dependent phosphoglycerate mutase